MTAVTRVTMRRWHGRPRGDDGAFPLEVAILAPVLIAFLCLVIAFGRTTLAGNAVDAAAKAGAREASIARNAEDAKAYAEQAIARSLEQDGIDCGEAQPGYVELDRFSPNNVGTPGWVTVRVNCTVSLAGIAFPGMPGSKTMKASFTSVVDAYRERG